MTGNGLFSTEPGAKWLIGMVHLLPLPGTPFHQPGSLPDIVERAVTSAQALAEAGMDGCLLQTVDRVYPVDDNADPARVAAMTAIAGAVRLSVPPEFRIGVQIMRNANCASLAVAKICGGSFIRACALVGATMSPQGLVQADPAAVLRYRQQIGGEDLAIVADIASMHYTWFGGGKPVGEIARAAKAAGAAAVTVSDPDEAKLLTMLAEIRAATPGLPVILAGGTDHDNAARLLSHAHGAFVGSCIEAEGWGSRIDLKAAACYVQLVRKGG